MRLKLGRQASINDRIRWRQTIGVKAKTSIRICHVQLTEILRYQIRHQGAAMASTVPTEVARGAACVLLVFHHHHARW